MNYRVKSGTPYVLQALMMRFRAILGMWKWRPLASDSPPPMFFVIGCGRSGNTLLRSMLMAGGEVAIPPESYVLPRTVAIFKAYSFLPWEQLSSLIISEFESFPEFSTWATDLSAAQMKARELPVDRQTFDQLIALIYEAYREQHFPSARLIGDKTPINTIFLKRLIKAFPQAKFVHILRDPRACVASYKKADLGRTFKEAVGFWKVATENASLAEALGSDQFIRVEYELLVSSPERELSRLCDFLGLSYSERMLDFWKESSALGDVSSRPHHAAVNSPLSSNSIDLWRKQLSAEEVRFIESECLSFYGRLSSIRPIDEGLEK